MQSHQNIASLFSDQLDFFHNAHNGHNAQTNKLLEPPRG